MPSIRSRAALVTSFSELAIESFKSIGSDIMPDGVGYMVGQVEKCPNTQKLHLQSFIQLKKEGSKTFYQSIIGDPVANVQFQKFGDGEAMIQYCKKEDSRVEGPWEYGEFAKKGSNKRKLREAVERSPERMEDEDPKVYRRVMARICQEEFVEKFTFNHQKKAWQDKLEVIISQPADDRKIIWIYGERGNEGKSTYAKKLFTEGWFYTRGGKVQDILYGYAMKPKAHVVFDIPRSQKDYINYSVIEQLKDGLCTSIKYEPIMIARFQPIHVVVMANFKPNMGEDSAQLSEDRVILIDCSHGSAEKPERLITDVPILMPYSEKPKTIINNGVAIDPSVVIRELPNGSHVCHEDEEFEWIWRRERNQVVRVYKSPFQKEILEKTQG